MQCSAVQEERLLHLKTQCDDSAEIHSVDNCEHRLISTQTTSWPVHGNLALHRQAQGLWVPVKQGAPVAGA